MNRLYQCPFICVLDTMSAEEDKYRHCPRTEYGCIINASKTSGERGGMAGEAGRGHRKQKSTSRVKNNRGWTGMVLYLSKEKKTSSGFSLKNRF